MKFVEYVTFRAPLHEIVPRKELIEELRNGLAKGIFYNIPHNIDLQFLKEFILGHKLKFNFEQTAHIPRTPTSENFRQTHWNHEKQIVPAKFISWSYFPWNSDSTELFIRLEETFTLRNKLANLPDFKYIRDYDDHACARIAVQFYPSGEGYMHEHTDPLNIHQYAIPTIMLSQKGEQFNSGGLYVIDEQNNKVYLDNFTQFGALTLFHTSIPHGVETIDPEKSINDCQSIIDGRSMMIAAVNSFHCSLNQFQSVATEHGPDQNI